MKICETGLVGAAVIELDVHADSRGSFTELLPGILLGDAPGRGLMEARQINVSRSGQGVLRGLHAVKRPPGQAKYVTCLSGAIHDVIVDVRAESQTFGHHFSIELSGNPTRQALYVPPGFAHGFLSLQPDTMVVYATSERYDPTTEFGICPLDSELGIAWPCDGTPVMSEKDISAPSLRWIVANELRLLERRDDSER